jgi:hypothetical protein
MAGVAADPVMDLAAVRNASPIVHAVLALALLLPATVLSVYKPFGMTAYGIRRLDEQRRFVSSSGESAVGVDARTPMWIYLVGAIAIALALLVIISLLMGASPTHH